jgi:hypothetical protein
MTDSEQPDQRSLTPLNDEMAAVTAAAEVRELRGAIERARLLGISPLEGVQAFLLERRLRMIDEARRALGRPQPPHGGDSATRNLNLNAVFGCCVCLDEYASVPTTGESRTRVTDENTRCE